MMVQDFDNGRREFLGTGDHPFYSSSVHLVYQPARNMYDLWALPFSLETLQGTAEAFPIAQNSRQPTVAADQTLVYLDGDGSGEEQLVWIGRDGKKVEEIGPPQERIFAAALSPGGDRVAVALTQGSSVDVWVWDLTRGVKTRLSALPDGTSSTLESTPKPEGEDTTPMPVLESHKLLGRCGGAHPQMCRVGTLTGTRVSSLADCRTSNIAKDLSAANAAANRETPSTHQQHPNRGKPLQAQLLSCPILLR